MLINCRSSFDLLLLGNQVLSQNQILIPKHLSCQSSSCFGPYLISCSQSACRSLEQGFLFQLVSHLRFDLAQTSQFSWWFYNFLSLNFERDKLTVAQYFGQTHLTDILCWYFYNNLPQIYTAKDQVWYFQSESYQ
jgi:hypothetical protein